MENRGEGERERRKSYANRSNCQLYLGAGWRRDRFRTGAGFAEQPERASADAVRHVFDRYRHQFHYQGGQHDSGRAGDSGGVTIGHLLHLEDWASRFFHRLVKTMHLGGDNIDMEFYITAVALFCCSGFGWYSTLTEGIAGDPNLLFAKSVLDFFTAMIFASTLGKAICAIPLPQCVILLCVFTAGRLLSGALTPEMFADLSACGGVLTMSAGFRVSKIKSVPLVDLMPALILVMPFSALWTMLMG